MTHADFSPPVKDTECHEAAAKRLEDAGLRATSERIKTLGLLMKSEDRAWTTQALAHSCMGQTLDSAGTMRLYRFLHLLEKKGVVTREIDTSNGRPSFGYRLSGLTSSLRFQCRGCGRVVTSLNEELRKEVARTGAQQGLPVSSKEMRVRITCRRCAADAT